MAHNLKKIVLIVNMFAGYSYSSRWNSIRLASAL